MAARKLPKKLHVGTFELYDMISFNTISIPIKGDDIPLEEAKVILLKCTAVFEGAWSTAKDDFNYGVIAPNFDLAALSFGIIQWNIKSKNLFALWNKMHDKNPDKFKECYEGGNSERFKPYFSDWPSTMPKDVWKTSEFIKFLSTANLESHYLWAKHLHKATAIKANTTKPSPQDWKTKPGFSKASAALQSELIDFCKRIGEVTAFQDIQREVAWTDYGSIAIRDARWLREACKDNYSDLMQKIELRTLAAIFDVAVQQGGFPRARNHNAAMNSIKQKISVETFSSQNEIIKMAVIEKAKDASNEYQNNCASRRLGFVNAEKTASTNLKGNQIPVDNCNYKLVKDNPFVQDV